MRVGKGYSIVTSLREGEEQGKFSEVVSPLGGI